MIVPKQIELWNGKKVIGFRNLGPFAGVLGKYMTIPTISILKEEYGKTYEIITVPILLRKVYDDGIEIRMRYCLDVRRKSKRQRALIMNGPQF